MLGCCPERRPVSDEELQARRVALVDVGCRELRSECGVEGGKGGGKRAGARRDLVIRSVPRPSLLPPKVATDSLLLLSIAPPPCQHPMHILLILPVLFFSLHLVHH